MQQNINHHMNCQTSDKVLEELLQLRICVCAVPKIIVLSENTGFEKSNISNGKEFAQTDIIYISLHEILVGRYRSGYDS